FLLGRRGICVLSRQNFEGVFDRFAELGDFFFLSLDQRIKLGNFFGVLSLLMFPKEEQIGVVLRPPPMKKELVLFRDRLPQFFGLVFERAAGDFQTPQTIFVCNRADKFAVHAVFVLAGF